MCVDQNMGPSKEARLIYMLHGFASAPKYPSDKADAISRVFELPVIQLSYDSSATFADNFAKLKAQVEMRPKYFVGTSLGAFYASKLAEFFDDAYAAPVIMLNPCHHPYEILAGEVGTHTNFHTGEPFNFSQEALDSYQDISLIDESKNVGRFMLLNMDDELIDAHETKRLYQQTIKIISFEKGGHRVENIGSDEAQAALVNLNDPLVT